MKPNDLNGNLPEDLLDRSISALRDAPVPDGPSPRTTADTLAALRRVAGEDPIPLNPVGSIGLLQRILAMTYAHRKTAASLTVAVGALAIWSMLALFSSVSYAQVVEKLKSVHSLTCTATVTATGKQLPANFKMMFLDPGHMRTETPNSTVVIVDKSTGRVLALNLAAKTATLIKYETRGTPPPGSQIDIVAEFQKIGDQKGEAVGETQIGNVKAKGFRVNQSGHVMTIWADPKTGLPVRIDIAMEIGKTKVEMVLSNVVLDAKLDESLFTLEVPKGYTLTTRELTVNANVEENVVAVLKAYSAVSDGKFPDDLSDPALMSKLVKVDKDGKPDAEFMKVAVNIGSLQGLLFQYEKGKTYDYISGIKLGEATRIVFWRREKETGKYIAVFGDLNTKEIDVKEVPPTATKPASNPSSTTEPHRAATERRATISDLTDRLLSTPSRVLTPPPVQTPPPIPVEKELAPHAPPIQDQQPAK